MSRAPAGDVLFLSSPGCWGMEAHNCTVGSHPQPKGLLDNLDPREKALISCVWACCSCSRPIGLLAWLHGVLPAEWSTCVLRYSPRQAAEPAPAPAAPKRRGRIPKKAKEAAAAAEAAEEGGVGGIEEDVEDFDDEDDVEEELEGDKDSVGPEPIRPAVQIKQEFWVFNDGRLCAALRCGQLAVLAACPAAREGGLRCGGCSQRLHIAMRMR